jgi:invasion protein IalB
MIALLGLTALLAASCPAVGTAQQKAPSKAAPKSQPATPEPPKPAAAEMPPLIYSNWTKVCGKPPDAGGKTVCRISKDGRLDSGVPMVGAAMLEMEGEARKTLQVMLPLGILLPRGTRVLIDNDEQGALILPIIMCAGGGCMAQAEANAEMVAKLKKGQNLYVQAYNMQQSVFTLAVPLADFAKAYDGPPIDPSAIEEHKKKLQDELEKRGRERLQQQK